MFMSRLPSVEVMMVVLPSVKSIFLMRRQDILQPCSLAAGSGVYYESERQKLRRQDISVRFCLETLQLFTAMVVATKPGL